MVILYSWYVWPRIDN